MQFNLPESLISSAVDRAYNRCMHIERHIERQQAINQAAVEEGANAAFLQCAEWFAAISPDLHKQFLQKMTTNTSKHSTPAPKHSLTDNLNFGLATAVDTLRTLLHVESQEVSRLIGTNTELEEQLAEARKLAQEHPALTKRIDQLTSYIAMVGLDVNKLDELGLWLLGASQMLKICIDVDPDAYTDQRYGPPDMVAAEARKILRK